MRRTLEGFETSNDGVRAGFLELNRSFDSRLSRLEMALLSSTPPLLSPPESSSSAPSVETSAEPSSSAHSPEPRRLAAEGLASKPTAPAAYSDVSSALGLVRSSLSSSPNVNISGLAASEFYLMCMQRGGSLVPLNSKQDRARGQKVLDWFGAMATDAERTTLSLRNFSDHNIQGQQLHIVRDLANYVKARLARAFADANEKVPKALNDTTELMTGTIETHLNNLKKKGPVPQVNRTEFAQFRAQAIRKRQRE